MTKELSAYYHAAIETLVKGGMTRCSADQLLSNLIDETLKCTDVMDEKEISNVPHSDLSDWEYDLASEIIDHLVASGMSIEGAMMLVAMHAAALEERLEH